MAGQPVTEPGHEAEAFMRSLEAQMTPTAKLITEELVRMASAASLVQGRKIEAYIGGQTFVFEGGRLIDRRPGGAG